MSASFLLALALAAHAAGLKEAEVPAAPEAERDTCPPKYAALRGQPDLDLYSYLGYRWVRSDRSTCAAAPSDKVLYLEPQAGRVSISAADEARDRAEYRVDAPEHRVRRNFYFHTELDGTHTFYSYDFQDPTGRRIPETIVLEFPNRAQFPLLPWEPADSFDLKYGLPDGASVEVAESAYEYAAERAVARGADGVTTTVRFTAQRKKELTAPDAAAVSLTVGETDGRLSLTVEDKWAAYYAGESLGLRVRLFRDRSLRHDEVAYEFDVEVPAQGKIVIQPDDAPWNAYRKHELSRGHEYYADWSFRRAASRLTKDDWVPKPRTNRFRLE